MNGEKKEIKDADNFIDRSEIHKKPKKNGKDTKDNESRGKERNKKVKGNGGGEFAFWIMSAVIIFAGYTLFFGNKLRVKTGQAVTQAMTFKSVKDGELREFKLKGKVYIIHFWATWCRVCRSELKHATRRAYDFNKRGIRYIMLNVDDPSLKSIRAILKKEGLEAFSSVHYSDALFQATKFFGVNVLPSMVMISPEGKLLHARTGIVPDTILEQWLQEVPAISMKKR